MGPSSRISCPTCWVPGLGSHEKSRVSGPTFRIADESVKKKVNVIITIIIECAYKQDSEYAPDPKYAKILNMAKFLIWQGSQYASVAQRSGFAWICLDRVLNISWDSKYARILNIARFWICKSYQDTKYATIWLIMSE